MGKPTCTPAHLFHRALSHTPDGNKHSSARALDGRASCTGSSPGRPCSFGRYLYYTWPQLLRMYARQVTKLLHPLWTMQLFASTSGASNRTWDWCQQRRLAAWLLGKATKADYLRCRWRPRRPQEQQAARDRWWLDLTSSKQRQRLSPSQ